MATVADGTEARDGTPPFRNAPPTALAADQNSSRLELKNSSKPFGVGVGTYQGIQHQVSWDVVVAFGSPNGELAV